MMARIGVLFALCALACVPVARSVSLRHEVAELLAEAPKNPSERVDSLLNDVGARLNEELSAFGELMEQHNSSCTQRLAAIGDEVAAYEKQDAERAKEVAAAEAAAKKKREEAERIDAQLKKTLAKLAGIESQQATATDRRTASNSFYHARTDEIAEARAALAHVQSQLGNYSIAAMATAKADMHTALLQVAQARRSLRGAAAAAGEGEEGGEAAEAAADDAEEEAAAAAGESAAGVPASRLPPAVVFDDELQHLSLKLESALAAFDDENDASRKLSVQIQAGLAVQHEVFSTDKAEQTLSLEEAHTALHELEEALAFQRKEAASLAALLKAAQQQLAAETDGCSDKSAQLREQLQARHAELDKLAQVRALVAKRLSVLGKVLSLPRKPDPHGLWLQPRLESYWQTFHPDHSLPGILLADSEYVHLRGLLAGQGSGKDVSDAGTAVASLPVPMRPAGTVMLPIVSDSRAAHVVVDRDGALSVVGGKNIYISVDGLSLPSSAVNRTLLARLQGGWSHYQPAVYAQPSYFRDSDGFVHLSGALSGGVDGELFTLPEGFRPARLETQLAAAGVAGDGVARVEVYPTGRVVVHDAPADGQPLSLDGVSFAARAAVWADDVPTLKNGWVPLSEQRNSVGFAKDADGVVHLKGVVRDGLVRFSKGVIFTLPASMRPLKWAVLPTLSNGRFARVDVMPNGDVVAVSGSPHWLSLDGLTFAAATAEELDAMAELRSKQKSAGQV
eukprot:PLAT5602.1.p1 GENE.PLAT5602.1~~PLAT5602.1.p1  ORF type:complete len:743 (+),score=460.61 PLAT5602.1:22-2229(+)